MEGFNQKDLRKKILGKVNYDILSVNEAVLDIEMQLSRADFDRLQEQRSRQSQLFICIDRSGSMSGQKIQSVRAASKQFVRKYFEHTKSTVGLTIILFDDKNQVYVEKSREAAEATIEKECQARGGTTFTEPIGYILNEVRQNEIKELQVIFLTDGLDNVPDKTRELSKQLRNLIYEKKIYSKFSVIGIGDHESDLLGTMAQIGTQRGLYYYLSSNEAAKDIDNRINQFFFEANLEMINYPGITLQLGDKKQIYCPVKEYKDDIVIVQRDGVIVQDDNPQDLIQNQIDTIDSEMLQQFQINKGYGVKKLDIELVRIYAQVSNIQFIRGSNSYNLKELQEILEKIKKQQQLPLDDFQVQEYEHLTRDINQIISALEKEKEKGGYIYHQRAIIETVKNEIAKRAEMRDGEVRIRSDGDVRKNVGYLYFVMKKLRWPKVQLRAVGQAIQTMNKIIQEFKSDIKGYKVYVEQVNSTIFGKKELSTAIITCEEIVRERKPGQKLYGDTHDEEEYQKKKQERNQQQIQQSVMQSQQSEDVEMKDETQEEEKQTPGQYSNQESQNESVMSKSSRRDRKDRVPREKKERKERSPRENRRRGSKERGEKKSRRHNDEEEEKLTSVGISQPQEMMTSSTEVDHSQQHQQLQQPPQMDAALPIYERLKSDKILNQKFDKDKLISKLIKMTRGRKLKVNRFICQNEKDINDFKQGYQEFLQKVEGAKLVVEEIEMNKMDRKGVFECKYHIFQVNNQGQ